jgi:hypothetical protein
MPASIMVANWREKTWSAFGLTRLNRPLTAAPASEPPTSCSADAIRPRLRSCSRADLTSDASISPLSSRPCALMAL